MIFFSALILNVLLANIAQGFSAGKIAVDSALKGHAYRHGDIEDALLRIVNNAPRRWMPAWTDDDLKRVYFGNWLRDMSQALDKQILVNFDDTAVRTVLKLLALSDFGSEPAFEVLPQRLNCYRPIEHIDNPRSYPEDAWAAMPECLRRAVHPSEYAIDTQTGMKNYIGNEALLGPGMTTTGYVRTQLDEVISMGRTWMRHQSQSARDAFYRELGSMLHALEDFYAHSNFVC
jgi:hypothetical protein